MAGPETHGTPPAQTMSQEITETLMRRVVAGYYPVDTRLPTERELAAEFGVTRHVVREALKRLEAVRLVRIRQGSGIYVQNLQLTGGIELFNILLKHEDGSVDFPFLKDVLEFRGQLFRLVARLAAARRTHEEMNAIRALVKSRADFREDHARLETVDLQLFHLFALATHNRIHELVFNTLGDLSIKLGALIDLPLLGFEQTQAALERIVEALDHKDEEMIDLLVVRYLNTLKESLMGQHVPQVENAS
jgi:GntR family transcriptional repressor for pyruvate dehydrogenase complex